MDIDDATLHRKINAELSKMLDESAKIRAEAEKIRAETKWYPLIVVVSVVTAAVAVLVKALS
jgi:hypothetical protein